MNNYISLSNGVKIPPIGLGTYPLHDKTMVKVAIVATEIGYRAFDTAHAYGNEVCVGNALKEACRTNDLKRSDLFITTKIGEKLNAGLPDGKLFYASFPNQRKDIRSIVSNQITQSLKDLQTDYLDLVLIHWPHPDYFVQMWQALEEEYRLGRVSAIGVSNCRERHIKKLADASSLYPMVNQIEFHPLHTRKGLIAYCQQLNIQVIAYSPLLVMDQKLIGNPVFKLLSLKYNKAIPQIILRWDIQQGVIPIPKSGNPARLQQNIDIFDFHLTNEDMEMIGSLNEDYRGLVESKYCPGY